MSDLAEMLLNAQNIQILAQINNNYNLINQIQRPKLLQENSNYNYDRRDKYSNPRNDFNYNYEKPLLIEDDSKLK